STFGDRGSVLTADLDARGLAGEHRGRSHDRTEGAVGELERTRKRILDFNLRMNAAGGICAYAAHRPREPLEQIDGVNALVHDRPAAVPLPSPAPSAGFVILVCPIPRRETPGPGELAESPFFDRAANRAILVLPSILKNARELHAFFLRGGDD